MSKFTAASLGPMFLLAIAATSPACAAPDEKREPTSQSCLRLIQIRSSDVIDKQHIVFTMNNGSKYVNTLPYPCPGLRRDTSWLHRTSLAEVCDLDIITVLNPIGGSFMPGASCGLGRFEPIAPTDVEGLRVRLQQEEKAKHAQP